MPKAKVASKALRKVLETKGGKGAAAVTALQVAEELENPYIGAAVGAVEGAALGSAFGPIGAVAGGAAGGLLGFVLADGERIVPIDMIAIPAYQYGPMLQGREPTFQLYIKEGEVIQPVIPTDAQMAGMAVLEEEDVLMPVKKPRKLSAWNRYVKNKKNHIKFKNGKLNLKKMGIAFRKGRKN